MLSLLLERHLTNWYLSEYPYLPTVRREWKCIEVSESPRWGYSSNQPVSVYNGAELNVDLARSAVAIPMIESRCEFTATHYESQWLTVKTRPKLGKPYCCAKTLQIRGDSRRFDAVPLRITANSRLKLIEFTTRLCHVHVSCLNPEMLSCCAMPHLVCKPRTFARLA